MNNHLKTLAVIMTPETCRAARGLLDISQRDLALISGVGISSIKHYESDRQNVTHAVQFTVQTALEHNGIVFKNFIRDTDRQHIIGVKLPGPAGQMPQ